MDLKNLEKRLRKLETEERILNGQKRVNIVKGIDIYECCKKMNMTDIEINEKLEQLITNDVLKRALLMKEKKTCTVSFHTNFMKNESYMWISSGNNLHNLLISVAVIIVCLFFAMFQMWPSKLRSYSVYVAYLMMAFIAFILVLGVIRLILFCITVFSHPPGIWLFPNLFADVGFIDSFIPLWSYHGVDTKPKKED